jgi:xanthine dehydrogenase YagS FAD-binding subunit
MLPNFSYVRPKTVKDAVKQLSSDEAHVYAGGTDLIGCLRDHIFGAKKIVSISGDESLKGIKKTGNGGLRIGAMTTITEVAENDVVNSMFPGLAQAASEVASPQLRNQGTIGGNLCQKTRCWYYRGEFDCLRKGGDTCFAASGENHFHAIFGSDGICWAVHPSDTAPVLKALRAKVTAVGPAGSRSIPLETFHVRPEQDVTAATVLKPDEILTEILIPKPAAGLRTSYRKVRTRRSWDFALVGIALALAFKGDTVADASIVLSGVGTVPWRSESAEKAVKGGKLDDKTIAKAAEAAVQGAEPLEHNGYKVIMLQGAMEEELAKAAAG